MKVKLLAFLVGLFVLAGLYLFTQQHSAPAEDTSTTSTPSQDDSFGKGLKIN